MRAVAEFQPRISKWDPQIFSNRKQQLLIRANLTAWPTPDHVVRSCSIGVFDQLSFCIINQIRADGEQHKSFAFAEVAKRFVGKRIDGNVRGGHRQTVDIQQIVRSERMLLYCVISIAAGQPKHIHRK